MNFDGTDLYAALIHELKNELGLLSMTLENIPLQNEAVHDSAVNSARLQCQGVADRLQQALLIYKSNSQPIHPSIDAWSPQDLVEEIRDRALALARDRLQVEVALAPDLPQIWFFDRDLVEMALVNAIHNSLNHARSRLRIEAGMQEGCLVLRVHDDSPGFPDKVLNAVVVDVPRHPRGTGLGLHFCRLIAQSHVNQGRRGEMRLRNDAGAVFSLLLP